MVQTTTEGVLPENRNRHRTNGAKTGNQDLTTSGTAFWFRPALFLKQNKWPQIEITLFNVNIDFQELFGVICDCFYMSVVQCENYFLFLSCRASGRHIESVFALSSSENVEVFDNNGTTNSTHFLLAYGKAYFCASILHIYQVWGIVSFIVVIGLSTTI